VQSTQRRRVERRPAVFDQRERGVAHSRVGDRPGRPGAEPRAAGDRDLFGKAAVAGEFGEQRILEERRVAQHRTGDFGAVAGERRDNVARRVGGAGERLGERAPDGQRGVVERGRHRHQRIGAGPGRQSG